MKGFVLLEQKVPAVVSKRGVDDGNQKGGCSPQPAQESHNYYITNFGNHFNLKWSPTAR